MLAEQVVLALEALQFKAQGANEANTGGVDAFIRKVVYLGDLGEVVIGIAAGIAFGALGNNQAALLHAPELLLRDAGDV